MNVSSATKFFAVIGVASVVMGSTYVLANYSSFFTDLFKKAFSFDQETLAPPRVDVPCRSLAILTGAIQREESCVIEEDFIVDIPCLSRPTLTGSIHREEPCVIEKEFMVGLKNPLEGADLGPIRSVLDLPVSDFGKVRDESSFLSTITAVFEENKPSSPVSPLAEREGLQESQKRALLPSWKGEEEMNDAMDEARFLLEEQQRLDQKDSDLIALSSVEDTDQGNINYLNLLLGDVERELVSICTTPEDRSASTSISDDLPISEASFTSREETNLSKISKEVHAGLLKTHEELEALKKNIREVRTGLKTLKSPTETSQSTQKSTGGSGVKK